MTSESPNDRSFTAVMAAISSKVKAIIHDGFEGWEGEIVVMNYTFEVSIKCTNRPS